MADAAVKTRPTAAEHAAQLAGYIETGLELERAIGNRGPAKFDADGKLDAGILSAFKEHGYYVFEGLVQQSEIDAMRVEIDRLLDQAPTGKDSTVDHKGRPAFGQQFERRTYTFIKPLSDPWGGTDQLSGRHPTQMTQPVPDKDAPEEIVYLMGGMCQTMESGLDLYGHPRLLAIAEAINGEDFVPFNDATFVKLAGLGGSVAWHQDGVTHWDSPDWDEGIHGFNFQVQLYKSTAANCLWVVPGSHKLGKIDIRQRVANNNGSEYLPDAVPLTCNAGDVTIVNRQMLHCSFANTSDDIRVSMTFGFHRRASVLGQGGALTQNAGDVYDEQRIFDRSSVIALAIDARRQHYPDETPYRYQPFVGLEDDFLFDPQTIDSVIKDYNLKDLSI
jgi:hypothetical protein